MNSPENMLMGELLAAHNNILHPEHNYYLDLITRELSFSGELLSRYPSTISAFGSARTAFDAEHYAQAEALGAVVAKHGYTALTGGGPGIMEAFSKGAYTNNGTTIGFSIKLPNEQASNDYLTHNITFNYFFTRKYALIAHSHLLLYFPGGYGTLDEMFEAFTLIQTRKFDHKEVVLVNRAFWEPLVTFINDRLKGQDAYISPFDDEFFRIIDTPEELEAILELYR
ncbi:MAG TPA: TIGR00730 family Rossman fold protein [Candidatus Paceibacterota bacterium]